MVKAMYSKHFTVGANGNLHMDGVDLSDIAKEFGTSAYVMSEDCLRNNMSTYVNAMKKNFGDKYKVAYASKAFCSTFIYKMLEEEGCNADVVSGGELFTALNAGFPAAKLHFHGNNKTDAELDYAIKSGIGSVVIDNYYEIARLDAICEKYGYQVPTLLRIKPGVDAHTHEFISTGHNDCKFGFGIEDGQAMEAAEAVSKCKNLKFVGVHCHIGSQIFEKSPFAVAADVMCKLMADINKKLNIELTELIMGGGFGIKYMPQDKPVETMEMITYLADAVKEGVKKYELNMPEVIIEPGRSMVGEAGATLYTVGNVREIPGARTYVAIDGGIPDNPRFALYQAEYDVTVVSKAAQPADKIVTIAGKCCESGDLISRDVNVQDVRVGDILCVFATGAYNYSMASNYNRIVRPPVVLITREGKAKLVVKRESFEDLVKNDIV